jgi:hypothetical protein
LVGEAVDTTHVNVSFAETANPGFIIALRVLFLPEFSMVSGVIFPFATGKEQRLLIPEHGVWGAVERQMHLSVLF